MSDESVYTLDMTLEAGSDEMYPVATANDVQSVTEPPLDVRSIKFTQVQMLNFFGTGLIDHLLTTKRLVPEVPPNGKDILYSVKLFSKALYASWLMYEFEKKHQNGKPSKERFSLVDFHKVNGIISRRAFNAMMESPWMEETEAKWSRQFPVESGVKNAIHILDILTPYVIAESGFTPRSQLSTGIIG